MRWVTTLSPDAILELHRILTEGTLDDPAAAGRLQRPDEERVAVFNRDDGRADPHTSAGRAAAGAHAAALRLRQRRARTASSSSIPSCGRSCCTSGSPTTIPSSTATAGRRAFSSSGSMRSAGYWLAEYLPISRFIREAPAPICPRFPGGRDRRWRHHLLPDSSAGRSSSGRSTIFTSTSQRKIAEVRDIERLLHGAGDLNGRQLALLTDAVRHPDAHLLVRQPREQSPRHPRDRPRRPG